jgi:hypothetical protein
MPVQQRRLQERASVSSSQHLQRQPQQRRMETGTSPLHSYDAQAHRAGSRSPTDSLHRPRNSNTANAHRGGEVAAATAPVAVTRSTSPIDQHIVTSILREDGIVNDDDFTVHIKSYQPAGRDGYPAVAGTGPADAPYDGCYDPAFDEAPRDPDHYSRLIRHRLRDVLRLHNDASDAEEVEVTDYEDLNTSEERGRRRNRNNYGERKYLRGTSHGRTRSASRSLSRSALPGGRGATEDLMYSVAQIMTAVGSIVAKPPQKKYKSILKKYARRKQREMDYMAPYEYHSGDGYTQGNPGRHHSPHSPHRSGLGGYLSHPHTAVHAQHQPAHHQQSHRQPSPQQGRAGNGPGAFAAPVQVPRSKAEMIDLVLAKLQVLPHGCDGYGCGISVSAAVGAKCVRGGSLGHEERSTRPTPKLTFLTSLTMCVVFRLQEIELNEQQTIELLSRASPAPQSPPLTYDDLQDHDTVRHLPTVRSVAVTARAPAEATVDSSLAVEAQSELDISLGALHTTHPSGGHRTAAANKVDGSTQDSPHTLDRLHAHLQQQVYSSSLGPSLESLRAQETHRTAETDQLSPQQLQERQRTYLRALPKVPRNPEAERDIYAYMKEMDR